MQAEERLEWIRKFLDAPPDADLYERTIAALHAAATTRDQEREALLGDFAKRIDAAVLAEREACAALAESLDDAIENSDQAPGCLIAAAIRARR